MVVGCTCTSSKLLSSQALSSTADNSSDIVAGRGRAPNPTSPCRAWTTFRARGLTDFELGAVGVDAAALPSWLLPVLLLSLLSAELS